MKPLHLNYVPPLGLPLYWGNEQSGKLPAAVRHYFDWCCGPAPDLTALEMGAAPLTQAEFELIVGYALYFIHAPCWVGVEGEISLATLRDRAKEIRTVDDLRRWNHDCMQLGLDPF